MILSRRRSQEFDFDSSYYLPTDLFEYQSNRFVREDDESQLLIFVDGACINNGSPYARAGWGVCVGPNTVFKGQLGCYEDDYIIPTNNRAELQGAIAALRLGCWKRPGINSVVIASDSEYVVKGYCYWLDLWEEREWMTFKGKEAKNRDLWEELDEEVDNLAEEGVEVFFWRIPRDWNRADKYAKMAARSARAK